jgi:hypothetical protein
LLSAWKNTGDNQLSSRLGTIFCWVGERIVGWQLSVLSPVVVEKAAVGMEQLEVDESPTRCRME